VLCLTCTVMAFLERPLLGWCRSSFVYGCRRFTALPVFFIRNHEGNSPLRNLLTGGRLIWRQASENSHLQLYLLRNVSSIVSSPKLIFNCTFSETYLQLYLIRNVSSFVSYPKLIFSCIFSETYLQLYLLRNLSSIVSSPKLAHRLWRPHALLFSRYRSSFLVVKQSSRDIDHSTASTTKIKKE